MDDPGDIIELAQILILTNVDGGGESRPEGRTIEKRVHFSLFTVFPHDEIPGHPDCIAANIEVFRMVRQFKKSHHFPFDFVIVNFPVRELKEGFNGKIDFPIVNPLVSFGLVEIGFAGEILKGGAHGVRIAEKRESARGILFIFHPT